VGKWIERVFERVAGKLFAVLLSATVICLPVTAAEIPEYKLKAAFLYNFASFTAWPEDSATFQLCIFGEDPFGSHLKQITSRKRKKHAIEARVVQTIKGLNGCQLVFIAPSASNRINQVQDSIAGKPVLTVADSSGALESGVMVNMETRKGMVYFEVNLRQARQHNLTMSSKLLRLAKRVVR